MLVVIRGLLAAVSGGLVLLAGAAIPASSPTVGVASCGLIAG